MNIFYIITPLSYFWYEEKKLWCVVLTHYVRNSSLPDLHLFLHRYWLDGNVLRAYHLLTNRLSHPSGLAAWDAFQYLVVWNFLSLLTPECRVFLIYPAKLWANEMPLSYNMHVQLHRLMRLHWQESTNTSPLKGYLTYPSMELTKVLHCSSSFAFNKNVNTISGMCNKHTCILMFCTMSLQNGTRKSWDFMRTHDR